MHICDFKALEVNSFGLELATIAPAPGLEQLLGPGLGCCRADGVPHSVLCIRYRCRPCGARWELERWGEAPACGPGHTARNLQAIRG